MAKKVFLAPSDQSSNEYAYGNTTEAIQCGRIAEATKTALERNGVQVEIGHMISMAEKCSRSNQFGADLHVPIHTNAYNGSVSGTRMFCYNTTGNGYKACQAIFNRLAPVTPGTSENIKVNDKLYEVRVPAAPTTYIEVDFHDVPSVAKWIIENVTAIGEAIAHGICDYFNIEFKASSSTPTQKIEESKSSHTSTSSDNATVALPKLRKGSKGSYVKTAQILLNKYNNAGLDEDGSFGDATNTAVYVYQRSRNLDVDGVIGVQTWNELLNPTTNKKSIDEIAREVIRGEWGNGTDRKNRLISAGYDYNKVQARVNELL